MTNFKRYEITYKMMGEQNEQMAFIQAPDENEALDKLSQQINNPLFYCLLIEENK